MDQDGHGFLAQPWPLTCPHFKYYATHTPDIDLRVITLGLGVHDFRRHPEDGALHGSVRRGHVDVICALRNTEVGDLAYT